MPTDHGGLGSGDKRSALSAWIEANHDELFRALRPMAGAIYQDLGLPRDEAALDLLTRVVELALDGADKFDTTRSVRLWLLGIARNVVLQWRDARKISNRRLRPLPDSASPEGANPERLFDSLFQTGTEDQAIGNIWVAQVLQGARAEDRQIIQMAVIDDLDMRSVAEQLHIQYGAARVRLHRALIRTAQRIASEGCPCISEDNHERV